MARAAGVDVLLIANNFPPVRGGSAAVYGSLARCATGRIMVVAPCIGYADGLPLIGWREHDRRASYRVCRLPLLRTTMRDRPGRVERQLFRLRDLVIRARLTASVLRLVLRERPRAVCIGELLASGWMVDVLGRIPGLRVLIYVHGEEITTEDSYDPDYRRRRRALLAADKVVVVSRFTQGAVLRLLGNQHEGRIVLIENGVDTARFCPAPREPELVARYRLTGQFVFITVCRLLEKKGVDHALRAFAGLLRQHPVTRYVIVGAGPFEPGLRSLAAELGIAEAVVFTGDIPEQELVEHYRLGDVFLMPNRTMPNGDTEGFGLVFLEANGCGLPVIAGGDGGSRDAVRDGENGLVVDGNSVAAIQTAMLQLREDAALRDRLGGAGLHAAAAADWGGRAEAFLRVAME